ncbi:MAG TPA: hypothetical protein VFG87_21210 [Amycolatopsis sp.]|jgi:hypothetical protein|nr:hypothetical protein [Amycolatopsis sp.]
MTEMFLVILILALTGAFAVLMTVRAVVVERGRATLAARGVRPPLLRRLDWTGVTVTLVLFAAVVVLIVTTVS